MPDIEYATPAHGWDRTSPAFYADTIARLTRILDRMDVRDTTREPTDTHPYPLRFDLPTGEARFEAWFYESCLTALTCTDRKVALRAAFQAYNYAGKCTPGGSAAEYLSECKARCEAFLEGVSP